MKKKGKPKKRQTSWKESNKSKTSSKNDITYFDYNKQGHFKSECPDLKKDVKKKKKKALMSTWEDFENDTSDEDEDEAKEAANLWFMGNQEDEVSPCHMTYDDLLNTFDDLLVDSEMMLSKYASSKKQNELLDNKRNKFKSKLTIFENKELTSLDLKVENDVLH